MKDANAITVCALAAGILSIVFFRAIVSQEPQQMPASRCDACSEVTQALEAAQKINEGATREDVEKEFVHDGGLFSRDQTIYVYRQCHSIKIAVSFTHDPADTSAESSFAEGAPGDRVKSVSRPYLEYPAMD